MKGLRIPAWFVVPALGWLAFFLIAPFGIVLMYSLLTKGTYGGIVYHVQLGNYTRAADWLYLRIVYQSLKLAFFTSVSCFVLGFPMAYVLARAPHRIRSALLVAVVLPFWTNFVVRAYAIKLLLSENGWLQSFLVALRLLPEPQAWSSSPFAIWIGMVTNYLPFMVLPLYVSLEKFDFTLLEAAQDLGARPSRALRSVLLPLIRPGIVTGMILVFTPALGEFVIPDLLGGARTMLIGNLVTEEFLKARDWPFGSALAVILMVAVLASLALYRGSVTEGVL